MVSVGSLSDSGQQVFDLETQSGVMHVLASVRASDINPEHKSELRDLVFLYTNGGKDSSVRTLLEQKISAYNVVFAPMKVSVVVTKTAPTQPIIGKFRTEPSFSVPITASAPVAESVPVVQSTPFIPVQMTQTPIPVQTPVEAIPASRLVPSRIVTEPVFVPEPIPVPVDQVGVQPAVPVATTAHPIDDKQYLDRIREIKASVNEKVGNPVNLVDINNEVGREYMGAILDAMKKLNSGTSAAPAMRRLEEAYIAVLHTLEDRDTRTVVPTPAPMIQHPESEPEVQSESYQIPAVKEDVSSEPQVVKIPRLPIAEAQPTPTQIKVPVASTRYEPESDSNDETTAPTGPKTGRLHIQDASPITAEPANDWSVAPVSTPFVAPTQTPQPTPVVSAPPAPAFVPLSDLPNKPLSIDELPTSESRQSVATAGDPFFSLEVDDGLDQLLQEWSIFKKSGLFGTGPKGREHPLFKKMAPLHIPLILAGRFEGATQETKQSVTDYMNGWRYEQGLMYQQGETFEHYLRRVIRHILDLQKGQRPA